MIKLKPAIIILMSFVLSNTLYANSHAIKRTSFIDPAAAHARWHESLNPEMLAHSQKQQYILLKKKSSYYGEVSPKTGRRKTVPVRGYRKKNGTYVPKHYRSPPRPKSYRSAPKTKSYKSAKTYKKSSKFKSTRRKK